MEHEEIIKLHEGFKKREKEEFEAFNKDFDEDLAEIWQNEREQGKKKQRNTLKKKKSVVK